MKEGYKILTRHAVKPEDLYEGWGNDKVRINCMTFKLSLLRLYRLVFSYCLFLIFKDIIKNKITFKIPRDEAYLEMGKMSGKAFENARKNTPMREVDYLASNFTGYHLQLRCNTKLGLKTSNILVNRPMQDEIIERTNNGEQW